MGFWKRLRGTFADGGMAAEDEVSFHIDMRVKEYMATGLSQEEARRKALLRFGNPTAVKEKTREMNILSWLESVGQDLRYGVRMLRRTPGLTLVAVLSLALGIGANTAIFSLLDAVMLKMLPVREPERLVILEWAAKGWPEKLMDMHSGAMDRLKDGRLQGSSSSHPVFTQLRKAEPFVDVLGFRNAGSVHLYADGRAEMGQPDVVSGNYFQLLGVGARVGRVLTEQDDRADATPAVVLSYGYWARRFGQDEGVIGKTLAVNGKAFTIVGVTEQEFFGLTPGTSPDLFVPMRPSEGAVMFPPPGESLFQKENSWWVRMAARLRPGVTMEQASAASNAFYRQALGDAVHSEKPESVPTLVMKPGSQGLSTLRSRFSQPLQILMVLVAVVLLIACANVANLLLARASARQRETAVRLAVGAGRARLVRQHLTESLLLAFLGGALGLLFSMYGANALLAIVAADSESFRLDVRPDARVLLFTAAVCLFTGLLFGLAPAYRAWREGNTAGEMREGRLALRRWLVVGQVAASLVLLFAAGLFVRSLQKASSIDLGLRREGLLLMGIDPSSQGYEGERLFALHERLRERLAAIPGVESVALSRFRLLDGGHVSIMEKMEQRGSQVEAYCQFVSPGYFETAGIPLVAGRLLSERDREGSPNVVVANEAFVRAAYQGAMPLGRRIRWDMKEFEIVGVVRDAKGESLKAAAPPALYHAFRQLPQQAEGTVNFHIRVAGEPTRIGPEVRAVVSSIDSKLPVIQMRSMERQMELRLVTEQLFARVAGGFGVVGLALAAIGVYGVLAYTVARRTREIGVRMALGAERSRILWMVAREVLTLVVLGLLAGLPLALMGTRAIESSLYGLKTSDVPTLAAAVALLAAAAVVAGIWPARTASRVDPVQALRHD
ncbi:MAG: ABC transporter permease [Bryobacteraceae bacterium]|nr:ABC transporter permease [Bryobacteraceae bacterium]